MACLLFDFVENLYLLQFATSEIFLVFKTRRFEFTLGLSITYLYVQGVRNVSFSENFAYVINGWPLS